MWVGCGVAKKGHLCYHTDNGHYTTHNHANDARHAAIGLELYCTVKVGRARHFFRGAKLSYANGKGAGRVSCQDPPPRGWVHQFSLDGEVPHETGYDLVLLHYPFCHYEE